MSVFISSGDLTTIGKVSGVWTGLIAKVLTYADINAHKQGRMKEDTVPLLKHAPVA